MPAEDHRVKKPEVPTVRAGTAEKTGLRRKVATVLKQPARNDAELSALVKDWVNRTWPCDQVKNTFIETELEGKLRTWRSQARWWRCAQISIWLVLAVLGLLISVFAGLKSGHGFTIIAGALVATLTTLTNAVHPSKQAEGYRTARYALRDEGWYLLNRSGKYKNLDDNDARYEHFVAAVHKIVEAKRTETKFAAVTS